MFGGIKRDVADSYFSKYLRLLRNFTCEHCGKKGEDGSMEASHFWGRRNESVRFDEENVSCLCNYCHRVFTENPHRHQDWMRQKLGEKRYKLLMIRAQTYSKKDRKLQALLWKQEYRALCKERGIKPK